jgi:hypothetical protein
MKVGVTMAPTVCNINALVILQVAMLEVSAQNATWAAMNWQPPPSDMQHYFNMIMSYFNPFTVTTAIQRWPHINWPQMMLNMAYGIKFELRVCSYSVQATPT